jgi:hypothetical protein
MSIAGHFASVKRRSVAAQALKPDGLSNRLMVGGCRPLFFRWVLRTILGCAFYRVCSPEADRRGRKATERQFWPFPLVCFRKRSHVGSALCSAEILLGPVAWTALCVGIRCTGRRFPKAAVFAGRGLSGPMQPSEVFQSVPPKRGWAGIFPFRLLLAQEPPEPVLCTRPGLLCKILLRWLLFPEGNICQ